MHTQADWQLFVMWMLLAMPLCGLAAHLVWLREKVRALSQRIEDLESGQEQG